MTGFITNEHKAEISEVFGEAFWNFAMQCNAETMMDALRMWEENNRNNG